MVGRLDDIGITSFGGRCQIPPSNNGINPLLPYYCQPDPVPNTDSNLWNTEGGMSVLNTDPFSVATLCPPWSYNVGSYYKLLYNFFVPDSLTTALATNTTTKQIAWDPYGVFSSIVNTFIAEYLSSVGGSPLEQYNGSTFGLLLNSPLAIGDNISRSFQEILIGVDEFNNSSYDLSRILKAGVKQALAQGKVSTINPSIVTSMTTPLSIFPQGRPIKTDNPGENRITALNFIENNHIHLKADINSTPTSMAQRVKQRYWVPPTDINLRVPVHLRDGTEIGVPVKDRCGIEIPTVSACWKCDRIPYERLVQCDHAVVTNSTCMKVWKTFRWVDYGDYTVSTAGEWCPVHLRSDIDTSYVLEQPHLSVVYGLLDDPSRATPAQYGFDMTVSSLYTDRLEEASGTGLRPFDFNEDEDQGSWNITPLYKEAYLVTLDCATLSATDSVSLDYRSTKATYNLAWETGDASSIFESAVSAYSGPRNTIYVDVNDPWLRHFVKSKNLEVTYTDLDIDKVLKGKYPRRINRDMLIVPVDKYSYNPAFGQSTLAQYKPRHAIVKRTLSTFLNPIPEIYNQYYTKTVPKEDGTGLCNDIDLFAIKFSSAFDSSAYEGSVFYGGSSTAPGYSILGKIINQITSIDANYNLDYLDDWRAMTQVDLLSFFNLNDVTEFFLRLPYDVRADLFEGALNNIKLLTIPLTVTQDSYLTADRITGTDLSGERSFLTVPEIDAHYYPRE